MRAHGKLWVCLAGAAAALAASGWTAAAGNAARVHGPEAWYAYDLSAAHNPVYRPNDPGVQWSATVPGGIVGGVIVVGHTVYGGGLDGTVFAMDADTGHVLWETHLPNSVFFPPSYVGGRLFVGIGNDVFQSLNGPDWIRGEPPSAIYSLDARTGKILWTVGTVGNDKTVPTYYNGRLYAADGEHWLRAIDPATGRVLWKVNDGGVNDGSNPAIVDGIIYLNTGGPRPSGLRAFSTADGRELWHYYGTNADNAPTVGGGYILAVNTLPIRDHGRWYLSDQMVGLTVQGKRVWTYTTSPGPMPPAYEAPAATYDQGVFYDGSTVRPYLYAFQAATGKLLWKARLPGFAYANPAVSNGYVFATTSNGYLEVLRRDNGQVVASRNLHAHLGAGAPVLVSGTLFLGTVNGTPAQIVRGAKLTGTVYAISVRSLIP